MHGSAGDKSDAEQQFVCHHEILELGGEHLFERVEYFARTKDSQHPYLFVHLALSAWLVFALS